MQVSVVIPVLNEQDSVRAAVCSALDAGAAEVIVVDGGSNDQTCEIVKKLDCKLLVSQAGRGRQLHAGALQANGETLLFLHADNRLDCSCLQQIKHALRTRQSKDSMRVNRQFGAFRQVIEPTHLKYKLLQAGNAARVRLFGLAYGDQAIFVARDFYFEVGGFPETALMEDVAFSQTARKFTRALLLPGPVLVSDRRWKHRGIIKQTLSNWAILLAYFCGVSEEALAKIYRKQDGKQNE